jgi:hypothetical protein
MGGIEMRTVLGVAAVLMILLTAGIATSVAQTDNSEYVIVANKQMQGSSINVAALKGIYLRKYGVGAMAAARSFLSIFLQPIIFIKTFSANPMCRCRPTG